MIRVVKKVFCKQFCFIGCYRFVKLRRYSRFTFIENTIINLSKETRAKLLGSDRRFCFISISKCSSFMSPFATIICLSEPYLRLRFVLVVQAKVISMTYDSSISSWKPRKLMRLDLISTISDIYIHLKLGPLAEFGINSRNTELKDILSWNISQMITKTVQITTRIAKCCPMKRSIPFLSLKESHDQQHGETTTWSEFPNGGNLR